jgi:hypothetical protein
VNRSRFESGLLNCSVDQHPCSLRHMAATLAPGHGWASLRSIKCFCVCFQNLVMRTWTLCPSLSLWSFFCVYHEYLWTPSVCQHCAQAFLRSSGQCLGDACEVREDSWWRRHSLVKRWGRYFQQKTGHRQRSGVPVGFLCDDPLPLTWRTG